MQGIENKRTRELSEDELTQLRDEVEKYTIEGDLRRFNALNIKRLKEIQCYRGKRHIAVRICTQHRPELLLTMCSALLPHLLCDPVLRQSCQQCSQESFSSASACLECWHVLLTKPVLISLTCCAGEVIVPDRTSLGVRAHIAHGRDC